MKTGSKLGILVLLSVCFWKLDFMEFIPENRMRNAEELMHGIAYVMDGGKKIRNFIGVRRRVA